MSGIGDRRKPGTKNPRDNDRDLANTGLLNESNKRTKFVSETQSAEDTNHPMDYQNQSKRELPNVLHLSKLNLQAKNLIEARHEPFSQNS